MPALIAVLLRSPLPYPVLLAALGLLAATLDLLRRRRSAYLIASTLLRWQLLAGLAPSLALDALLLGVRPDALGWPGGALAAAACTGLALLTLLAAFGGPLFRLGALIAPAPLLLVAGAGWPARTQLGMIGAGALLLAIEVPKRPRHSVFARTRL